MSLDFSHKLSDRLTLLLFPSEYSNSSFNKGDKGVATGIVLITDTMYIFKESPCILGIVNSFAARIGF